MVSDPKAKWYVPLPRNNNAVKREKIRSISPFRVAIFGTFPYTVNFLISGLFITLYQAVERLLIYQEDDQGSSGMSASASARCILFHELCPALYAIMSDGLKPEVITSFGRMKTTVWSVIEALTRQGPSSAQSTCDLVMLLNSKFAASGEDERKFAGFVAGLLK